MQMAPVEFITFLQGLSANIVSYLNGLAPEWVWLLQLVFCGASILILFRFFGKVGLYVYIAIALIGANIQVIKLTQFGFFPEPIALGTILFITTYLCTDILSEHYGYDAAKRGVWIGFFVQIVFLGIIFITLGFQPLTPEQAGIANQWAVGKHEDIQSIFMHQFSLYIAGYTAYLISQHLDVWLYNFLKWATHEKYLWVRNNASTMISSFIDNAIFSILAWKILSPHPMSWHTVIFSYILGVYIIRFFVALFDTPFIYLARYAKPKNEDI